MAVDVRRTTPPIRDLKDLDGESNERGLYDSDGDFEDEDYNSRDRYHSEGEDNDYDSYGEGNSQ